jgi:hypothetical protein
VISLDALSCELGQGSVAKLTNQLADGLPRELSISKKGPMKLMQPVLDAGLIVKHGTAKTRSVLERAQRLGAALGNIKKLYFNIGKMSLG